MEQNTCVCLLFTFVERFVGILFSAPIRSVAGKQYDGDALRYIYYGLDESFNLYGDGLY